MAIVFSGRLSRMAGSVVLRFTPQWLFILGEYFIFSQYQCYMNMRQGFIFVIIFNFNMLLKKSLNPGVSLF